MTDKQPTFRHLDDPDVPWQQVKRQRNADGTESSVWEKWLAFSPDPQYLSLYAAYDPGMIVRRHGHYSPHVVFVIDGERLDRRPALPGRHPRRAAVRRRLRPAPRRRRRRRALRGDDGRPTLVGRRARSRSAAMSASTASSRCPTSRSTIPPWLQDLRASWKTPGDS